MQGYSVIPEAPCYTAANMGRPANTHRTAFGERFFRPAAKRAFQAQVADKLGITQQSLAAGSDGKPRSSPINWRDSPRFSVSPSSICSAQLTRARGVARRQAAPSPSA